MKNYGKYDSGSQRLQGKKFTRHTRGSSIHDSDNVPVKEVNIFEIQNMDEERINNLKSFHEPENAESDQVVLEYENIDYNHLGTSPIELEQTSGYEIQDKTLSLKSDQMSDMTSDIKD